MKTEPRCQLLIILAFKTLSLKFQQMNFKSYFTKSKPISQHHQHRIRRAVQTADRTGGQCHLLAGNCPLLQSVLGYSVELEVSEPSRCLLLMCLIEPQRVSELERRFELPNKRSECRRSRRPGTGKLELLFVVRAYMILSFGFPRR